MTGGIKHYYAHGNTAVGPYSLFESAFQGLERLFVLTGEQGTDKSTIFKQVSQAVQDRGYDVQWFHSPWDDDALEGLIVTQLRVGVVDGTSCRLSLTGIQGTVVEVVGLDHACDLERIEAERERIVSLEQEAKAASMKAYETFAKALKIHDEWEKYYIGSMIFAEANKVTQELAADFLGDRNLLKKPRVRHLFLGAATPAGPVDYIMNLTDDCKRRIFIKGRPGSGKSTMLKKLAVAAEDRGFDVDVFHCGFDPNSLDMLIFPELGVSIFDSTAPHEHFPSKGSDEILDMYERTMIEGTDEKYAEPVQAIKQRYAAAMQEATAHLAKAKELRDQANGIVAEATDEAELSKLGKQLVGDIEQLIQVAVGR
ncbi:MAG: hypothetical protein K0R75_236 [Paenibacillaceae bacterium]|nr:hypothetical protein [Paenibacillaceae bacterium]